MRVRPGASRTRVGGSYGEPAILVVAVTDPASDGRANAAVVRALADALGVPKSRVAIVRGHSSRTKAIAVTDAPADLAARWAALMSPSGDPATGRDP